MTSTVRSLLSSAKMPVSLAPLIVMPSEALAPPIVTPVDPEGVLLDRWAREFRRYRLAERMNSSRPGLGLRLEFTEAIDGPLLLGQLCHFGYGIFVPESR